MSSQESVPESPSCSRGTAVQAAGPAPEDPASPAQTKGRKAKAAEVPSAKLSPEEPASLPDPQAALGRRLRVYWPLDDAWYSGVVKQWKLGSKQHVVLYDDGAEEAVDLAQERFEWEKELSGGGVRGAKAVERTSLQVPSTEEEEEEVVTFKKRPRVGQGSSQSRGTEKATGGRQGGGQARESQKRRKQARVFDDEEEAEEDEAEEASSGSSDGDEWKLDDDEEAEEDESEEEVGEASEEELQDTEEEEDEEDTRKVKGRGRGKAQGNPVAATARASKGSPGAIGTSKAQPSRAMACGTQSARPPVDAAGLRQRMVGAPEETGTTATPALKGGAPSQPSGEWATHNTCTCPEAEDLPALLLGTSGHATRSRITSGSSYGADPEHCQSCLPSATGFLLAAGLGVGLDVDLAGEAAERFSGRLEAKFDFLHRYASAALKAGVRCNVCLLQESRWLRSKHKACGSSSEGP